ncbi:IclR family transcriptional regulator [Halobacteria archaeon AArc-m2/3/4]|uniref:IclR family transcriptional regulator n=1 Tax=Natronoglomus mannanivorans TaxID=2979990 RepID=A0AAP2Z4C7_9EURY|nr:IclR family transcriptional regulator [Halobacteria archaeon AArc-xg1-1]MCU4975970.1 IclR family transcriptional regulator [Halobacteria archaeon AArc-m2/3/4]
MANRAKNPVKTTTTTFTIVEALKELDSCGVTELANHLQLPKSTVHNYLSTLEQEEYVKKEGNTYSVGIRFLELGAYARDCMQIYDIAKTEVDRLADETRELANLMIEEHGHGVYIHQAKGEQAVQVDSYVGTRVDLHATALGKSILAHLPEDRIDTIVDNHGLPQCTERTVSTREELENELELVRKRGYATDDEERLKGLRCVAAPIQTSDGRVLGAVSASGPVNRMQEEYFENELPNRVLETVNVIELNVTYS